MQFGVLRVYTAFTRHFTTRQEAIGQVTNLPNCNPLHLFTRVRREKWFHYSLLLKPASVYFCPHEVASERASDTCDVLFLYEAIVNIPARFPPPAQSLPALSQPFLCVEVTSQNSLHCTVAIERLDPDTAPSLSGNHSSEVTWSRAGEEGGKRTKGSRMDGSLWR